MLIKLDKVQQQHPGEVSLVTGKMQFEKALFKEAYQSFNNAFILSEGHCFGIGDEKYLEFYRNPEKYIK